MPQSSEQRIGPRTVRRLAVSLSRRPLLCLAMTLYWLWVNMGLQMPIVFKPVLMESGLTFPSQLGPLLASVLSYLAISVRYARKRSVFKQDAFLWAVCAAMAFSSAVVAVWLDATMVPAGGGAYALADARLHLLSIVLYAAGSLLFGLSSAFLCIELQRIFGSLGSEHVLFHGSVAMLGSVAIAFALSQLPIAAQQAAFIAAPLPIAFCLVRTRAGFTKRELFGRGEGARLHVPLKLLVTALLHGLSLGLLLGQPLFQNGGTAVLACSVASYAAAAGLLLMTAISVKLSFNNLIYQIVFPLVAFGLYLSIVGGAHPLAGVSVQLVGFCYLHLIMWGVCAFLIKRFDLPPTWVIGTSTCSFMAGQLIGGVASGLLGQLAEGAFWIDKMNVTALLVMLCASLFMMSNRNLRTGWGLARPDTADAFPAAGWDEAVAQIASDAELTKREASIFALLAKGKNRQAISEELCISRETAKSHMQNVYKKTGVHSQQELLTLLEAKARQAEE